MHVLSTPIPQLTGQSVLDDHYQVIQPAQWNTHPCAYPSPRRLHGTLSLVCAGRATFPLRTILNRTFARLLREICRSLPLQGDAVPIARGLPSQPKNTKTPAFLSAACPQGVRHCPNHPTSVLARSFVSNQSCLRTQPTGGTLGSSSPSAADSHGLLTSSTYEVL